MPSGRRFTLCSVAVAIWLALAAPAVQAGAPEHEGVGEVQVVGGNLVSARRRALRNARQDAVARAVAARVDAARLAELEVKLRSAIYRRASRYIRTYRVLEETHQGKVFRVRVAVKVNAKRLQGDLSKLVGRPTGPVNAMGVKAKVGVWLEVKPAAQGATPALVSLAHRRITEAGFIPVALKKPGDQWSRQAQALGAAFALRVTLELKGAPGVRGLDLAGANATATLWLGMVATGAKLTGATAVGWGAAIKGDQARSAAAERALDRGLRTVLGALKGRLRPGEIGAGKRVVHVSGLTSYDQYRRITRALRERITGVARCEVRRTAPGEVWYAVQTTRAAKALAAELQKQTFGAFLLKTKNTVGGSAWMIVETVQPARP